MTTNPLGARRGLERSLTVFFGAFGILAVLLSLAPGAPTLLGLSLRAVSATFLVAGLARRSRSQWATSSTVVAAALGIVAAVLMGLLILVFIFPWALAILAVVLLVGSGLGMYVAIRSRQLETRRTLEDQLLALRSGRLLTVLTVLLAVFVVVPLLGAIAWSSFGCGGRISASLCA